MRTDALIIGGSIAGLQAALDLADSGVHVHLIESSPFLENQPTEEIPVHLLNVRALEIIQHPKIKVWNNTVPRQIASESNNLAVEIYQKPRSVDLSRCTACGKCIDVCPVTLTDQKTGQERKAIFLGGQPGCAAIDKPGKAPCSSSCPGGIHVQGYVALIAQKRFGEAISLIREAIPFPSVCGRVCNHYCEANCTRGKVDASVNIMALKRFVSDWAYEYQDKIPSPPERLPKPTNFKVAIVGAGPSGLTAARDLIRIGHAVTVFDSLPVAGGMMRVGIPPHRLPTELLNWEIQQIIDEGVTLKLNTWVDDIPGLIESGFDAVLIATGAHKARKLQLRNSNHPDNWLSLDFLRRVCLGEKIDLAGKNVVVLGGGNVALDTVRTAVRLGASAVRMVCLEPRGEMPGFEWEVSVAENEGVELFPGRTFKEIVLENDKIVGVLCASVNFHGVEKGRLSFDVIPETDHILPGDLVIWAIGQGPDFSFLPHDGSIDTRFPVGIRSDENMMTTMPGVFVAGDVHRGMTFFVIDAIGEGHKAARAIDRYLRPETGLHEPPEFDRVEFTTDQSVLRYQTSNASGRNRVQIPTILIEERLENFKEVDLRISMEQALTEAARCLQCGNCSECLSCLEVCEPGAIDHQQSGGGHWLNIGAILITENTDEFSDFSQDQNVFRVSPEDALGGSAAAAQILANISIHSQGFSVSALPSTEHKSARIGVFICTCGETISNIMDTGTILADVSKLDGVTHSQILPYACSPEGPEFIQKTVAGYALNQAVLAACSCCNIDQICYSCTYQRVRCKDNLGIFTGIHLTGRSDPKASFSTRFEFVNIREQCAWVHQEDKHTATQKTIKLIAAAVGRLRAAPQNLAGSRSIQRSSLILGSGSGASICDQSLRKQGINAQHLDFIPTSIQRSGGLYEIHDGDQIWTASTLVLSPQDHTESMDLMNAFGRLRRQPQVHLTWGGLETHRPGIFYICPTVDPDIAGAAASTRVNAWIGRTENRPPTAAVVDPERCRACKTCIDTCEYCAPELVEINGRFASWIDPAICTSCGTCAAHCPSGAITAGCSSDAQLEAMMDVVLQF